jgi:hypothetical protein
MNWRRNCIFLIALFRICPTALHLGIVRGPTMNYNAYNVVETAYETFALAVAFGCLRFAYSLRGRAAGSSDTSPLSISGGDAFPLSAYSATVRSQCRAYAASDERPSGNHAAADCRDGEQADERRPALRHPGPEQAGIRHQPVLAEFRLRRRPRFPAGDRGQGPIYRENIPRSLTFSSGASDSVGFAGQPRELSRC